MEELIRAYQTNIRYEGLPKLLTNRMDFMELKDILHGGDAYILGGGSSFSEADPEVLADKFVIGCNEAFRLGSRLVDWNHFTDVSWWQRHREELMEYDGVATTTQQLVYDKNVRILKSKQRGIEFNNTSMVAHNRNTGLGAINIAIHLGAARIILLGFDMKKTNSNTDHWYDRDDQQLRENTFRMHRKYALEVWEDVEAHGGIEILNASPDSGLPFWPKISLDEAFNLPPIKRTPNYEIDTYTGIYGDGEKYPNYGHTNHGKNSEAWLLSNADSVVDVGCGHNELVLSLRKGGLEDAIGIDFACDGADEQCDITSKTKFSDGQFDVCTSFDFMEHLHQDDVDAVLTEMSRISSRFVMSISTVSGRIKGPSGGPLHLTVKPNSWWFNKIRPFASNVDKRNGFVTGCWNDSGMINAPVIDKVDGGKK
jgi:2-polyprenyl-3-methyl-5-hydroxy-6-metoxy-1,4-benzoquinol methylase